MTPVEWAGLAVAVLTLVTGFAGAVRWLVKHYLYEPALCAGLLSIIYTNYAPTVAQV